MPGGGGGHTSRAKRGPVPIRVCPHPLRGSRKHGISRAETYTLRAGLWPRGGAGTTAKVGSGGRSLPQRALNAQTQAGRDTTWLRYSCKSRTSSTVPGAPTPSVTGPARTRRPLSLQAAPEQTRASPEPPPPRPTGGRLAHRRDFRGAWRLEEKAHGGCRGGAWEAAAHGAHRPRLDCPAQRPAGWVLGGTRPNTTPKKERKGRLQHLLPLRGPSRDPVLLPGLFPTPRSREEPADHSRRLAPNLRPGTTLGNDVDHMLRDNGDKWGWCAKGPRLPGHTKASAREPDLAGRRVTASPGIRRAWGHTGQREGSEQEGRRRGRRT